MSNYAFKMRSVLPCVLHSVPYTIKRKVTVIKRLTTKPVYVGGIKIGGGGAISVQSMCNTKTDDIPATLEQISRLHKAGCDIVRLAVPDEKAAAAFYKICSDSAIPVVADIHFNHKLAIICANGGAAKIRINPGNIGGIDNVRAVADVCKKNKIPIRIGVNLGSIDADIERQYGRTAEAMVQSVFRHVELLNRCDFDDIVLSLKASDVPKTVEAYRIASERCSYPLHLGVTEAGTEQGGIVKSAMGIGALLLDGIGDTIRVSLTALPEREISVAKTILKAAGLLEGGIEIISCPSCGRCRIDLIKIANEVEAALQGINKPLRVAVMGCIVNGPGEAKDADIGIAGGSGCAMLFKKGEIVRKIEENEIVSTLLTEIENWGKNNG